MITFLILNRIQKSWFADANNLAGWNIQEMFPDAARELEEGAKCLALQRSTAAVFHAMRMLEIGINKFSEMLEIDPPTRPSEKNWGHILNKIKETIDERFPKSGRLPGSDGAAFEGMYASLDAVKNPWRNGTMHVESFYTESEALHIANCVLHFMQTLARYLEPSEVAKPESTDSMATKSAKEAPSE